MQAWRTIQALLIEIDGDEADCFAKFPAYIERYKAADKFNYAQIKQSERGNFEAVFFCLAGCITTIELVDSDSDLSIVSSSRYAGLEEDWRKDSGDSEVRRTRSRSRRGKRVRWEQLQFWVVVE